MIRNGSSRQYLLWWAWAVTNGIEAKYRAVCLRGSWPPRAVDCEISHRLERGTKLSLQGCGNLSLVDAF